MSWGVILGLRYLNSHNALFTLTIIFVSCLISFPSIAESKALILFPQVKEPYSTIFIEIIDGFNSSYTGVYEAVGVNSVNEKRIAERIETLKPDMIVALGSLTLKQVSTTSTSVPLLVGAIASQPNVDVNGGVSMVPGADVYLGEMLRIVPKVESVYFVFDPERDQQLQQHSNLFLEKQQINSRAFPARDIREAASAYKQFLQEAKSGDVVWIYPNSKLINSSLLSEILDKAWRKRLVVFSSNPVHVKRGALFALYPDNNGIGRRLGELANNLYVNNSEKSRIEPLQYVKLVVNARTSDHLGLTFENEARLKMDLILPGR